MADSFLDIVSGVPTLKAAVASSAGAGDAGKIPRLGAAGVLDPSLLPTIPGCDYLGGDEASNSAYLPFDGIFSADYDIYTVHFVDLAPVADNVTLLLRWRDAGADVTGTTHYTGLRYIAPTASTAGSLFASSTSGHVCPYAEQGNAAGECANLTITMAPRSGARKEIRIEGSYVNYLGNLIGVSGNSTLANTTAMTGFKVLYNTTNISSGKVLVYGWHLP